MEMILLIITVTTIASMVIMAAAWHTDVQSYRDAIAGLLEERAELIDECERRQRSQAALCGALRRIEQ
jgi:hypothetical protein